MLVKWSDQFILPNEAAGALRGNPVTDAALVGPCVALKAVRPAPWVSPGGPSA